MVDSFLDPTLPPSCGPHQVSHMQNRNELLCSDTLADHESATVHGTARQIMHFRFTLSHFLTLSSSIVAVAADVGKTYYYASTATGKDFMGGKIKLLNKSNK